MEVNSFAKLENWHVVEGTLYIFHITHLTILFDLSSVLITYIFGNILTKTYFEANVIRVNSTLKNALFQDLLALSANSAILPQFHSFYEKLTGKDLGFASDKGG